MNTVELMISIMVLLTSCGSHESKPSNPSDENKTVSTTAPSSKGVSTSYYVAKDADLKECTDDTRGFLAYVKEAEEFKACLASGWTTVSIKGKDGSNGKDGSSGAQGIAGKDGQSAAPNDNTWTDPVTGKKWLIGATSTSYAPYYLGCPSGYTLPTSAEALAASVDGLTAVTQRLNGTSSVWAQRPDTNSVTYIDSLLAVRTYAAGVAPGLTAVAALACYK